MDGKEATEIPFGAFDSELKGWEYTIPEGMEAIIKDGKIIVREKESEDERIRMEIISYIKSSGAVTNPNWIAWLEKQGSQILANSDKTCKVEPKFKVGDWVVQEGVGTFKIIEICESWYEVIDCIGNRYSIAFLLENGCHLWAIEDAKDGDVLVHSSSVLDDFIFIYNSTSILQAYCYYSNEKNRLIIEDRGHHCPWNMQEVTPATKEQRETLFKAMHEAGYEWDAEKKELKKIDQNSAWSEEDEEMLRRCISATFDHGYLKESDWLKSLKDRYTWKPSDEQMQALKSVVRYNDCSM